MNKIALLRKLEELYGFKEVQDGFPTQQACIDWSNRVSPLLKFNQQYYINFVANAHKMNLPLSAFTMEPAFRIMVSQLQMAIEELKHDIEAREGENNSKEERDLYIDEMRLDALKRIPKTDFDLTKLIRILEEINLCSRNECYLATILLVRALIDHVPPIFGCKTFSEVASNYKGSKSFKESMKHLEESCRKIADQHLHGQIRKSEVLPNKTQVDFKNDLDVLLGEVERILR